MSLHMREDLDRAMAGVTLSPARRAAILEAAQRGERPVKKLVRPVLALAAALAALTLSAFALVPELRAAVAEVLGSFAPYSQTVEGVSVTDQGIEVRVVSALSDATTARVYLAVRDMTGNRLEDGSVSMELEGGVDRTGNEDIAYSFGARPAGYDSDSGTAFFEVTYEGGTPTQGEDALSFQFGEIQPGCRAINELALPQALLTDRLLETQVLSTGETVLKPGQTEYAFPGEEDVSLSSMGFASDGRFHLLLALADGADPEASSFLTTLYSKTAEDSDTTQRYNTDIRHFGFALEGKIYYEFSTLLDRAVYADLELSDLYGTLIDRPVITGTWALQVKLEQAPQRSFVLHEVISGITWRSLTLSPFTLTIGGNPPSDGKEGGLPRSLPVAVLLRDGTVLHPRSGSGMYSGVGEGDRAIQRWNFEDAVDVTQVIGVAVGYWLIPLDGDTAGPGYWLKELPQ